MPSTAVIIYWFSSLKKSALRLIHNNNLKLLHISCSPINRIEVSAAVLDIFSVGYFITKDNFFLTAPRLLQCSKNYWTEAGNIPNMNYNISYNAKEQDNMGYSYVVSEHTNYLLRFISLAVSVDLMNPKEVYMLQQVFIAWNGEIKDLEIFFKVHSFYASILVSMAMYGVPKEEGESSISGEQKKKWQKENSFFSSNFRIKVVRMYNFSGSNKEELALASLLVTEGRVRKNLMIETSSLPAKKKLEIEATVAKLKQLPKGNKRLSIECF
ncbi:unnamed protein product [Arabis nemorensis]|uniref:FBD domain-containing protein n=1 Tax=Arabis nemorensis TaxID=586526 RepID=A0A565BDI0_9BRAS|nr:unnamed protein product [Arabis nemorensis]